MRRKGEDLPTDESESELQNELSTSSVRTDLLMTLIGYTGTSYAMPLSK